MSLSATLSVRVADMIGPVVSWHETGPERSKRQVRSRIC